MWFEQLEFPTFSVFREKYCSEDDVLAPDWPKFSRYGIGVFRVEQIPDSIQGYDFRVVHFPEGDTGTRLDYAHCEVRVYFDGREVTEKKAVRAVVRTEFRTILSERIVVIKEPEQPEVKAEDGT